MEAGGPSKVICRLLCHLSVGVITVQRGEGTCLPGGHIRTGQA